MKPRDYPGLNPKWERPEIIPFWDGGNWVRRLAWNFPPIFCSKISTSHNDGKLSRNGENAETSHTLKPEHEISRLYYPRHFRKSRLKLVNWHKWIALESAASQMPHSKCVSQKTKYFCSYSKNSIKRTTNLLSDTQNILFWSISLFKILAILRKLY